MSDTFNRYNKELNAFKTTCYNSAVQSFQQKNGTNEVPPPTDSRLDYNQVLDPTTTFEYLKRQIGVGTSQSENCNTWFNELKDKMKKNYDTYLSKSQQALAEEGISMDKVQKVYNGASKIGADELMNEGIKGAHKESSWWDSVKRAWDATSHPGNGLIGSLNEFLLSAVMLKAKLFLLSVGLTYLWICDYYIFEIVSTIKTIAAIAILLGVLYYMFFHKLDIPLTWIVYCSRSGTCRGLWENRRWIGDVGKCGMVIRI